jgi:hypothetical protein
LPFNGGGYGWVRRVVRPFCLWPCPGRAARLESWREARVAPASPPAPLAASAPHQPRGPACGRPA